MIRKHNPYARPNRHATDAVKKLNFMDTLDRVRDAFFQGDAVARSYRPGDVFLGAYGELDKRQISGVEARAAFVTGYLQALPRPIETDKDNVITSVGVPKK